jgi:hypothetical protein
MSQTMTPCGFQPNFCSGKRQPEPLIMRKKFNYIYKLNFNPNDNKKPFSVITAIPYDYIAYGVTELKDLP